MGRRLARVKGSPLGSKNHIVDIITTMVSPEAWRNATLTGGLWHDVAIRLHRHLNRITNL